MPDVQDQITFELRVLQYALTLVVSEEDADSLAKLIFRLTAESDTWIDPNTIQGQQIALKALICDEVMRAYKIETGQVSSENEQDGKRSFANICKQISSADSILFESFCQMLCFKISGGLLFLFDSINEIDSCNHVCKQFWLVEPAPTFLSATG